MEYTSRDYLNMKTPLSYQMSEYDCATACWLNAVKYLCTRGEIQPAIIKQINECTLDTFNENGEIGKIGTSIEAMKYLCEWINKYTDSFNMNIHTKLLQDKEANVDNTDFLDCIKNGGVAILRVWDECHHYVLCTKVDDKNLYLFDPYYLEEDDCDEVYQVVLDKPYEYNRIVKKERMYENSKNTFSIVDDDNRFIILIYRV